MSDRNTYINFVYMCYCRVLCTCLVSDTILFMAGVEVGFEPATYMVSEGGTRDLRVVVRGSFDVPIEVRLSTTGISATGIILDVYFSETTNLKYLHVENAL